jgi:hypothetical protein
MSTLDINTERGRVAAADQKRATEIVFGNNHQFHFLHTPTTGAAAVDGFICKDGIVTGVAEIKSRDTTYENLMTAFGGEWLVTHQKLLDLQSVSRLLKIPAYGLLYLTKSGCVVVVAITDSEGFFICHHREETTKTQKTCNGGEATRENSFIDVFRAKVYRERTAA